MLTTLISREKLSKNKLGENLVKMLWIWHFLAVDSFDFTRKIVEKFGEKIVKMQCSSVLNFSKIVVNNLDFPRKVV